MFESFDESDLLAYVEDELPPEKTDTLRMLLAAHPRALAVIEAMRHDRAILGTDPEPAVPDDLLAELEPMMARPMLMADPQDWRRRYRPRRGL